jgi:hypothetical protein
VRRFFTHSTLTERAPLRHRLAGITTLTFTSSPITDASIQSLHIYFLFSISTIARIVTFWRVRLQAGPGAETVWSNGLHFQPNLSRPQPESQSANGIRWPAALERREQPRRPRRATPETYPAGIGSSRVCRIGPSRLHRRQKRTRSDGSRQ